MFKYIYINLYFSDNIESAGEHNQIGKFTDFADIFDIPAEQIRTHLIQLEGEHVPRHQKIIGESKKKNMIVDNYVFLSPSCPTRRTV